MPESYAVIALNGQKTSAADSFQLHTPLVAFAHFSSLFLLISED